MPRTGHKGHETCEYTSKAACDKARRIAIGQCSSMLDEDRQCPHWGVDTVDDKGYCGQHLRAVFLAADEHRRNQARKDEQNARIDAAIAWHAAHPSILDMMPRATTG